ncbi:unnamed protein product [Didymodactylos carnosus]|uniref:Uncharacterized protein n=1 Tax=Didymodactylos carnosus TaxID=1234261 RepID=A0A816CXJ1_9BILA|nr:unnamed protein product [Didymodactylos carnosus]CAF4521640.1 unnamed protein product [Didymodactylos carnosus]
MGKFLLLVLAGALIIAEALTKSAPSKKDDVCPNPVNCFADACHTVSCPPEATCIADYCHDTYSDAARHIEPCIKIEKRKSDGILNFRHLTPYHHYQIKLITTSDLTLNTAEDMNGHRSPTLRTFVG